MNKVNKSSFLNRFQNKVHKITKNGTICYDTRDIGPVKAISIGDASPLRRSVE